MTDQPLTLVDSHGDDSDESHNPFDDRVEQAQKELMWAQLQRRYMNVWEYTSRRWNAADILIVELTKSGPDRLRFIEFDKNKTTSSQPLPGSYVTLRERVANLVTAATVPSGLAQPIVVSHVHGDATFDDILTEVYKSAAIRTYSDQHTRLPAHSHYADRRAR